jgi:hypothetical protein
VHLDNKWIWLSWSAHTNKKEMKSLLQEAKDSGEEISVLNTGNDTAEELWDFIIQRGMNASMMGSLRERSYLGR